MKDAKKALSYQFLPQLRAFKYEYNSSHNHILIIFKIENHRIMSIIVFV